MPYRAHSSNGIRQSHSTSKSYKLQDTVAAVTVNNTGKKLWNFGSIIGQGGFGLIYLGIILPMYVLLKLVELGPCDVPFFTASISLVYVVHSVMFSANNIQLQFSMVCLMATLLSCLLKYAWYETEAAVESFRDMVGPEHLNCERISINLSCPEDVLS